MGDNIWEDDPELAMEQAMFDSPNAAIQAALDELVVAGYVERRLGPDGKWRYRAVRPYRARQSD
jgi:hypothetical protein